MQYISGSQPFETRGPLTNFVSQSRTTTENCATGELLLITMTRLYQFIWNNNIKYEYNILLSYITINSVSQIWWHSECVFCLFYINCIDSRNFWVWMYNAIRFKIKCAYMV